MQAGNTAITLKSLEELACNAFFAENHPGGFFHLSSVSFIQTASGEETITFKPEWDTSFFDDNGGFFSINCYRDRGTINYTVFLKKNIVEDVYFAAVHFLLLSIFHIMLLVASASFLRCLIS